MDEDEAKERLRGRHIVLVLAGPVLGGAERGALELGRELQHDADARVSVCSLASGDGRAREVAAEFGLPWIELPAYWRGRWAARLRTVGRVALGLRRLRPDLVVSFTNRPNVLCALAWRATGATSMVWNQCDVLGTTRFGQSTFGRALRAAPVVTTTAHHARQWLVREWGADAERVHVIRSVVDLPPAGEAREVWRARLGLGEADIAACMLAHLHAGKDHDTLLRAWRLVVDDLRGEGRRVLLLLAGRDAGGGDAARATANDLGLGEHVRFLGEVADVSGLLGACELAVFSSRSECLGRGATEPMAAGLPVVGTDVPGIREAVGETGADLLAPAGDAAALAAAVVRLARAPELRAAIGRANAEQISSRHSRAETTHRYLSLFAAHVDGRRGSAHDEVLAGTTAP